MSSLVRGRAVRSVRVPLVLLALAVPVVLAGCSVGPAPTDAAEPVSPLDQYYSALYGGDISDDEASAQNRAVQDSIAACMVEQGFEYQPDASGSSFMVMGEDDGPAWGSEEFAATYGYGITNSPMGSGAGWSGAGGADAGSSDPNASYVASLSESEQAAYQEALWGAPVESDGAGSASAEVTTEYDWTAAGCTGAAQHEVMGESEARDDPEFTDLISSMDAVYEKVLAAPAVVAAEQEWLDCMADAGHGGLTKKDDVQTQIFEKFDALNSGGDTGDTLSTAAPDVDPAALKALQQEEIALATSDFACARDTGYADTLASETTRIEQAFVDENRKPLDALVARYGRG